MTTVAYLGPEHTNTHLAALRAFGPRARYRHEPTVDDVFTAVECGGADYGVVPVENSLEGAVTHTLDRFIDAPASSARIVGEVEVPIRHCLITQPGMPLRRTQAVYSHPQALAQCRRWLRSRLARGVALIETASTADAVDAVVNYPRLHPASPVQHVAAIGREEAARTYRLRAVPIPDDRDNKTRFLILSRRRPFDSAQGGVLSQAEGRRLPRRQRTKTSLLLAVKDRPGALYDVLMPFKREAINLTKIESRPSKQKAWEYAFFIDLAADAEEPRVRRALRALRATTVGLRILGCYPAAGTRR